MTLIQSMLSDKKYFALEARKDTIRDYLAKFEQIQGKHVTKSI